MSNESSTPRPTIFVVDDDAAMLGSLQALLSVQGISVRTFPSARAFLDAYRPEWTGCLLVDYLMPDMSGLDLLAGLRRRKIGLPAIVMTGHGDGVVQQAARDAGAAGTLDKPFRVEDLMVQLQRCCPAITQE